MMRIFGRELSFNKKHALSQYSSEAEANYYTKLSVNHPFVEFGDQFSVMAALRAGMVIAQGVGQVDLTVQHVSKSEEGTIRKDATNEAAYKLLNRYPNDWMTSVELREAMTLHAVFTGAGRALIRRGVDGRPLEIIPLHPTWCDPQHDRQTGQYLYNVSVEDFSIHGRFTRDDIIEVTNPRWDFLRGLNVTRKASAALGLSKSIEARQGRLMQRDAPYGIIHTKNGQSQESINKMKAAWVKQFGAGHGIGVLDFEAEFQRLMGSPADEQSIENREFQIEEVARAYGVFPAMLMSTANTTTFASAQEFFSQHIVHTMRPWLKRWEQGLDRAFFHDSRKLRAVLDEKGLFRASPLDQAQFAAQALGAGGNVPFATVNEVRDMFGWNPIEGGGDLVTNMSGGQEQSPSISTDDTGV